LSQANVSIHLRDGRTVSQRQEGARGYPGRLSAEESGTKFLGCAQRSLPRVKAEAALAATRSLEQADSVQRLVDACVADLS
jgi:hypothetical protein